MESSLNQEETAGATRCLERLSTAKRRLLFDKRADAAFWFHLALQVRVEISTAITTACTDGQVVLWNPSFLEAHDDDTVLGLLIHELAHLAFAHHVRMANRELRRWNIACDATVNFLIERAGFRLPQERLLPGHGALRGWPLNQSAEAYYELTPPISDADTDADPGRCGGVRRAAECEADARQEQAVWEQRVAAAHQYAQQRGDLSANLARCVQEVLNPTVDWAHQLRDFLTDCLGRTHYSWLPPSRRHAWRGLYLPALARGETLPDLVLAVDTSGSIGQRELDRFAGEISGIIAAFPGAVLTILYHDSAICHVQRWSAEDGPLTLKAKGGGGTSHVCVLEWIDAEGMQPTALVALTDLDTCFPAHAPVYPVLWASTTKGRRGPFGRTVEIGT